MYLSAWGKNDPLAAWKRSEEKGSWYGMDDMHETDVKGTEGCISAGNVVGLG